MLCKSFYCSEVVKIARKLCPDLSRTPGVLGKVVPPGMWCRESDLIDIPPIRQWLQDLDLEKFACGGKKKKFCTL